MCAVNSVAKKLEINVPLAYVLSTEWAKVNLQPTNASPGTAATCKTTSTQLQRWLLQPPLHQRAKPLTKSVPSKRAKRNCFNSTLWTPLRQYSQDPNQSPPIWSEPSTACAPRAWSGCSTCAAMMRQLLFVLKSEALGQAVGPGVKRGSKWRVPLLRLSSHHKKGNKNTTTTTTIHEWFNTLGG